MTIGNRIKSRRIELGLSVDDLAKRINKNRATIYRYEKGDIESLPTSILEPLAKALNTSPEYLIGWVKTPINNNGSKVVNVLGRVSAGTPLDAIEYVIDTEEITEELASTGSFFGLQIKGDSMEPRICDGDVVIVRQQSDAESGDIVIAMVNGDDAVCKRLKKYAGGIALISLNTKYEPMMFSEAEIESKPVKILGKVVELRGKF
ncbi:MAG: helix-turn-helix domain-containing protein [Lachnospiraceae bacterium]|nr:helix-turn-helix domain-containing protein [Lachnospiraceae bacterium]